MPRGFAKPRSQPERPSRGRDGLPASGIDRHCERHPVWHIDPVHMRLFAWRYVRRKEVSRSTAYRRRAPTRRDCGLEAPGFPAPRSRRGREIGARPPPEPTIRRGALQETTRASFNPTAKASGRRRGRSSALSRNVNEKKGAKWRTGGEGRGGAGRGLRLVAPAPRARS